MSSERVNYCTTTVGKAIQAAIEKIQIKENKVKEKKQKFLPTLTHSPSHQMANVQQLHEKTIPMADILLEDLNKLNQEEELLRLTRTALENMNRTIQQEKMVLMPLSVTPVALPPAVNLSPPAQIPLQSQPIQSSLQTTKVNKSAYSLSIRFIRTLEGHSNFVNSLAAFADGTLASGSTDNTIKLWDPSTGTCLHTLTEHSNRVSSLAVLADETLASGSQDNTIKLWNPSTEECLRTLTVHPSYVCSLAVVTDQMLASGSWDGSIKFWNPSTGECLRNLTGHLIGTYFFVGEG